VFLGHKEGEGDMNEEERVIEELRRSLAERNAIIEAIEEIIYDENKPSDFMLSFRIVRDVWNICDSYYYLNR
jgi:hypothetical protein